MRLCLSFGIPMPVSCTAKKQCHAIGAFSARPMAVTGASRRTEIEIPPWSVNLMALPTRFSRIWRKRSGSPTIRSGTSSATDKE